MIRKIVYTIIIAVFTMLATQAQFIVTTNDEQVTHIDGNAKFTPTDNNGWKIGNIEIQNVLSIERAMLRLLSINKQWHNTTKVLRVQVSTAVPTITSASRMQPHHTTKQVN